MLISLCPFCLLGSAGGKVTLDCTIALRPLIKDEVQYAMFIQITLYLHLLAATAWIGGALLLFALGIFLRDKSAQSDVYLHLGPIYGYFETVWLVLLWITGVILFSHFGLWDVIMQEGEANPLDYAMTHKLRYVAYITLFTIIHMAISFKTDAKSRTKLQHLISRFSAFMIFFLNLGILWFAIQLREILSL